MKVILLPREPELSQRPKDDEKVFNDLQDILKANSLVQVHIGLPSGIVVCDDGLPFAGAFIISMARSPEVLMMQQTLELFCVNSVNKANSILLAQNKPRSFILLNRSGIPVPPTRLWLTNNVSSHTKTPAYPVKKVLYGTTLEIRNVDEAIAFCESAELDCAILQEHVAGVQEYKVYLVGNKRWIIAVKYSTEEKDINSDKAVLIGPEMSREAQRVADIAYRAAATLGLYLASVDILVSDRSEFVIDVNDFPSYRFVQDAGEEIYDGIFGRAFFHKTKRKCSG